ncbi:MAG TPA: PKD domain-containing protein [Parafilimonas sp.]|nr:PKD domain-containing protein [Parafilimonas sp.]
MKLISRFIAGLLLLLLSFTAKSQDDSLYATHSVYKCGLHYILVFKYKPVPDSVKIKVIKLKFAREGQKDSVINDTLRLLFYSAKAILHREIPEGTEQLTDPVKVAFVLESRGIFVNFLQQVFDKLCNQPKKEFAKPMSPVVQAAVPGHSNHWKPATKRGDNSFWMIGSENAGGPGDTIVLSGAYSYAYISKDYSSDVVLYTDGKQVSFKSGISVENTNHLRIDGSGGSSFYGIRVNGGGTNLSITGKSNYIDVGYVDLRNGGVGGLWDKTEVSDVQNKYDCDQSYLYPTRALHHRLHHISLKNIQGDALYEGSTGSTGGRPMNCGGVVTYPKPMGGGFVELDHIVMDSINRQGGQVSGCDSGYVLVHDNIITNTGYEYNPQQGAGFAIGGLTKNAKVYNNQFHHNFLYNFYSYGDGVTEFHDNVTDTAGQVGTKGTTGWKKNTEQLASTLFAPQKAKSQLIIENNKTGYNTAVNNGKPVGFVIYGDNKILSVGGNVFCNNVGNLVNNTGVGFQTTCSINGFTITATTLDTNVTIKPAGVTSVNQGGSQQYTITPRKGYDVADVKVDNVSIGAATSYTFTDVQANHTIIASSAIQTFSIMASSKGEGNISPAGTTTVNYNGKVTYTITPNDGWHTESIIVDGVAQDVSLTKYTFTKVKEDHKISVTFATNIFTIVSSSAGGGHILPEGETIVNAGKQQSYVMKANAGSEVADVIIDGTSIGVVQEYTFYNVMESHTIHVDFKIASGPNLPPISVPAFRTLMSSKGVVTSLSGELSSDDDGNIISYVWKQTAGTTVNIVAESDKTTIVAGMTAGSYTFELTVTDNSGDSSVATVRVRVIEESAPWSEKYAIEVTPSVKK